MPTHLKRIHSVMDKLPSGLNFSFQLVTSSADDGSTLEVSLPRKHSNGRPKEQEKVDNV